MRALFVLLLSGFLLSGCQTIVATGVSTTGVAAVEERSIGTVIDDSTIYAEIYHLFVQADANALLPRVDVRVNEGRVLLTGQVARHETALEAVRLVWLARGVKEVINEMDVTDPGSALDFARDQVIETQIEARLLATKEILSVNYTVEVVGGVAYLLGIAQDEKELKNAAHIASRTKGVTKVVSYVRLKNGPYRPSSVPL